MAGPWEKYAAPTAGPWAKYGDKTPQGQIPGAIPGQSAPAALNPAIDTSNASLWDQIKGAGETALTIGSGMLAFPYGTAVGVANAMRSGKFGTREGADFGEQMAKESIAANTYQPRTATGQSYVQSISDFLQPLAPLAGLGNELATVSTLGKPAGRLAKDAVRANTAKTFQALQPSIDPELLRLGRWGAANDLEIRPDMLSRNRLSKFAGQTVEDVPFSGGRLDERHIKVNKFLIRQIGGDETSGRLTSSVFDQAMNKSGEGIGEIMGRTNIPMSGEFASQLDKFRNKVLPRRELDTGRIATNYLDELYGLAKDNNGVIPGPLLREFRSELVKQAKASTNGDVRAVLGQLEDIVLDSIKSSATPDDAAALQPLMKQYAIGKSLEPLVAKAPMGNISPDLLMGIVTNSDFKKSIKARGLAGDMGNIADYAKQFLKEPNSSGTTERALGYKLAGYGMLGAPAAINPAGPALLWGVSNAYNRLGPKISRFMLKDFTENPLAPEWTTSLGVDAYTPPPKFNPLGDLTPELPTTLGAGGTNTGVAIDANQPLGIKQVFDPRQQNLMDRPMAPQPSVDMRLPQNPLDPYYTDSRLKGRPQMLIQSGLPGVDDIAISGGMWTDAAEGAYQKLMSLPDSVYKMQALNKLLSQANRPNTPAPNVLSWPTIGMPQ
jgi:hypothetical protein